MPSLDGLLIVVAAAFAAPFLLGLAPTGHAAGLAVLQTPGPVPARAGRFGTS